MFPLHSVLDFGWSPEAFFKKLIRRFLHAASIEHRIYDQIEVTYN